MLEHILVTEWTATNHKVGMGEVCAKLSVSQDDDGTIRLTFDYLVPDGRWVFRLQENGLLRVDNAGGEGYHCIGYTGYREAGKSRHPQAFSDFQEISFEQLKDAFEDLNRCAQADLSFRARMGGTQIDRVFGDVITLRNPSLIPAPPTT